MKSIGEQMVDCGIASGEAFQKDQYKKRLAGCKSILQFTETAKEILAKNPSQIKKVIKGARRFSGKPDGKKLLENLRQVEKVMGSLENPTEYINHALKTGITDPRPWIEKEREE